MSIPRPLLHEESPLATAIVAAAERTAGLLGPDTDPGVRIPGALWTVGEAAAHLALANELMADVAAGRERAYGDGTAGGLAAANAESLAAFTERDPAVLGDAVARHAAAFVKAAAARDAGEPVVGPLGPMDLGTLGSYLLTHILGHGYDIAVALRRPHMIDAQRAALTVPFLMTAMPRVLNSRTAYGLHACYDIRLRGDGPRFAVTFTHGALTVTEEVPRRADCVITAEPVTFLLMALGRRTTAAALARGHITARGRRPWLAARFPALFVAP
ncbi:maleylpyruvate isomerase family mycothiol-dependent enzyme [Actinacidiphila alni]|uniref:maleylpyruvate isomerase family mycothiol-dependent enzyme n=1 Tax=Actinacidiphila alni TaxID=380248 RepID=UPI0033FE46D7